MRFDHFLNSIELFQSLPLPGVESHDAILPEMTRQRSAALKRDKQPKISAVAATLFPKKDEAHLLLIERQSYDGVHSNQVGFPGGKVEEEDENLKATSLREMEEEVGVDREAPRFIRELSEVYIPPSRFLVHPFCYWLPEKPLIRKDEREVKEVIELPLSVLMNDDHLVVGKIKMSNGISINTPYFAFNGYKIWGATAMMLSEMRQLFKAIHP